MPEDREEVQRRRDREEMEARGRVGAMFIIFFFLVLIPAWVFVGWYFLGLFRTTPLKGTKHPNKTANSTNGTDVARVEVKPRWWVYQHPPTNTSRYGPEEEAYRKKREALAKAQAEFDSWYIRSFEGWYMEDAMQSPDLLGGAFLADFVFGFFKMGIPQEKRYKPIVKSIPPSTLLLDKCRDIISRCLSDALHCAPIVLGHLHYGEAPDVYYQARNAFFVSRQNTFVRLFVIDLVRLQSNPDGSVPDLVQMLRLLESENPLTDGAWIVDQEYPDSEDRMSINIATFSASTKIYDEFFPPILNFLHQEREGIFGIRFTEVIGKFTPSVGVSGSLNVSPSAVPNVEISHGDSTVLFVAERRKKADLTAKQPANGEGQENHVEQMARDAGEF
jgi:hypothetical protein